MRILITVTSFCKDLTGSASIRYACSRLSLGSCGTCGSSLSCWPLLSGSAGIALWPRFSPRNYKVKYCCALTAAVRNLRFASGFPGSYFAHLNGRCLPRIALKALGAVRRSGERYIFTVLPPFRLYQRRI